MEAKKVTEEEEERWRREIVTSVMRLVSTRLPQTDLISLLLVSPWLYRTLVSYPSIWLNIDLREMTNAGDRLLAALSLPRYRQVKHINLEFSQGIVDSHLNLVKARCPDALLSLKSLNLNGCQKISDSGIEDITSICPKLKVFSIYWNVRVTDAGIKHLVKNCRHIIDLNLSGCKSLTDKSMELVAESYQELQSLNITRCVKIADDGLLEVLQKCSSLQTLNLYALSGLTDKAYKKISLLADLRFLDLCGAQNLSDEGLGDIAKCDKLESLNLTWCVRITDAGVITMANSCTSLEFLSLFGIVGVTDRCLETLSQRCSSTLTTLDVNGCIGIKRRSREALLQMFPRLTCFKVHS
ncbi:F-box protein At3g58530 [Capsella rubella]|uniref:F-box protein At3g58530 n=1 Tax=Capsella rubella TaxID=81985 RepID=UPI000CD4AFAC|nr:F-box protein At3g58530 [Capsella rubella]XP_023639165.1 F-box protein At3g58530 [Capsella rubella]XP_023639166.1 F-box protein At3g58530 [Capsella rubella]